MGAKRAGWPPDLCWVGPDVASGPSAIAGIGLFATAPITAGAQVIVVDEGARAGLPAGTVARFGNHSCDPNLGWTDEYTLVAVRDIAAGEELTSDYATSTADPDYLLRCHCQTYRCRQLITGDDWRIPELQRRYAGHWVPALQRRIGA